MPCGTKTTDNLETSTVSYQVLNSGGSIVGSGSFLLQANGGSYKSVTGRCTPKYAARVARGELIPYTPWIKREFVTHSNPSYPAHIKKTSDQSGDKYTDWITGTWGETSVYAPYRDTNDSVVLGAIGDNRDLLLRAAASAYSSNTFDAGTFLGEMPETIRMMAKTVQRFRDIKDRQFRKMKNFDPHSFLLESRYGWSPFYRDMKKLGEHLRRQQKLVNRVVGRSRESYSTLWSSTETASDPIRTHVTVVEDTITITGMASVAADYVQNAWKFNPIITGYELLPYSFVLDWFWNVSQALKSAALMVGASSTTSCAGWRISTRRLFTRTYTAKAGYTYVVNPSGSRDSEAILTFRYPMSVPYLPPIKVNLDANKIADLIAMIAGLKAVKTALKAARTVAK